MDRTTAFSPTTRPTASPHSREEGKQQREPTRAFSAARGAIRRNLVGFGLFIALWALIAPFFPAYVLPSPVAVLQDLPAHVDRAFVTHVAVTLGRVGLGFLIAFMFGTALGIVGHVLHATQQLNALMVSQHVIPGTILGVIFLLIFGVGGATATALVTVLTLPLIAINTANALANVDEQLVDVLVSMGGDTLDQAWHLYLPTLVPTIQSNLTLGFGLALKVAILGEFMGAQDGLGYLLNVARVYFRMDVVFFYLLVVLCATLIVQIALSLIFRVGLKRYFNEVAQ